MPLAIAAVVLDTAMLCYMLAITRNAWRTLPPGAQVPVHGAATGWNRWQPKESALRLWAVIGALIWLLMLGLTIFFMVIDAATRSKGGTAALPVVLLLPMVILSASEHFALKTAARAASDPDTFA